MFSLHPGHTLYGLPGIAGVARRTSNLLMPCNPAVAGVVYAGTEVRLVRWGAWLFKQIPLTSKVVDF